MEIILKQDVPNLGYTGDVVKVRNGFGRNYLIPKGFAILATPSAVKINAENKKQRAHKETKIKDKALEIASQLQGKEIIIGAKTSTTGKIFGSVNSIQLAEAINKKGFEIDRKQISFKEDHIKEVGKYTAIIKLHRDVKVEVAFEVISE
jgi:large subunit ribosomal protein L9